MKQTAKIKDRMFLEAFEDKIFRASCKWRLCHAHRFR